MLTDTFVLAAPFASANSDYGDYVVSARVEPMQNFNPSFQPSNSNDYYHNMSPYSQTQNDAPSSRSYEADSATSSQGYPCEHPSCIGSSPKVFGRKSDLTRHQLTHHETAIYYHCGCCRNVSASDSYKSKRKDHIVQHIQKKHSKHGVTTQYLPKCELCRSYFVSQNCLALHNSQEHNYSSSSTQAQGR